MKKISILPSLLLLSTFSLFCVTTASLRGQNNFSADFEGGIPSNMAVFGNSGFSQQLSSSPVYSGSNSLAITLSSGSPQGFAYSVLSFTTPIQSLSFALYDEFAGNAPFYMYFYAWNPGPIAWPDAGLADNVQIWGDSNSVLLQTINRSVGWHIVSAELNGDTATFSYDGQPFATYTSNNLAPLYELAWNISNAGTGTHSMYIDNVQVELVPEPSTYALLLFSGAASLWALKRRKS
jgi:hypothetical protein